MFYYLCSVPQMNSAVNINKTIQRYIQNKMAEAHYNCTQIQVGVWIRIFVTTGSVFSKWHGWIQFFPFINMHSKKNLSSLLKNIMRKKIWAFLNLHIFGVPRSVWFHTFLGPRIRLFGFVVVPAFSLALFQYKYAPLKMFHYSLLKKN